MSQILIAADNREIALRLHQHIGDAIIMVERLRPSDHAGIRGAHIRPIKTGQPQSEIGIRTITQAISFDFLDVGIRLADIQIGRQVKRSIGWQLIAE